MKKLLALISAVMLIAACVPATTTPTPEPTVSVPSAPTGVTATASSKSVIGVTWTASSGATSYEVYDDSNTLKATVTASPASITGLTSWTTYTYKVKAVNSAGSSDYSSTASDKTYVSYSNDINVANNGTKGCLGCHGTGAVGHFDQAYQTAWGNDATWLGCVTTNGEDCSFGGGMGWAADASHRVLIRDWKAEGFDHTN